MTKNKKSPTKAPCFAPFLVFHALHALIILATCTTAWSGDLSVAPLQLAQKRPSLGRFFCLRKPIQAGLFLY